MSKYQINWLEQKTTQSGIKLAKATLKDESGNETQDVTLWASNWPNFNDLRPGTDVEGDIVEKQNGQYTNKTLYPIKQTTTGVGFKGGGGVKAAQERKAEMIKDAQERKEESIAFFNATNSAIELVSNHPLLKEKITTPDQLRQSIIMWRDWFYQQWLNHELPEEPEDEVPF